MIAWGLDDMDVEGVQPSTSLKGKKTINLLYLHNGE